MPNFIIALSLMTINVALGSANSNLIEIELITNGTERNFIGKSTGFSIKLQHEINSGKVKDIFLNVLEKSTNKLFKKKSDLQIPNFIEVSQTVTGNKIEISFIGKDSKIPQPLAEVVKRYVEFRAKGHTPEFIQDYLKALLTSSEKGGFLESLRSNGRIYDFPPNFISADNKVLIFKDGIISRVMLNNKNGLSEIMAFDSKMMEEKGFLDWIKKSLTSSNNSRSNPDFLAIAVFGKHASTWMLTESIPRIINWGTPWLM